MTNPYRMQDPTEDHNGGILIVGSPFAGLGQMIAEAIAMNAIPPNSAITVRHPGFESDMIWLEESQVITEVEWMSLAASIPIPDVQSHFFSLAAEQAKLRSEQLAQALQSIQFDLDRARRLPGLAAPPKSRRRNRGRNKALDRIFCKEAYCQRRE